MIKFQKREIVAGIILIFSSSTAAIAKEDSLDENTDIEDEEEQSNAYLNGPNILEVMIQDNEQATPPTPVNGGYLTGLVLRQRVQANWLLSDVGLQLFHEGEKLDPRRYQVEWKIVSGPSSVVKAQLVDTYDFEFVQRIHIEAPISPLNSRFIAGIEIEARITDREQPDKAPIVVVQTLRELLANGRDGL